MAKKIFLFSPPFNGHLNVLKNLIWKYQGKFDFHLVITGWKNIHPELNKITVPVTILAHSNLNETDPAIWTLPRAVELMDDCLRVVKKEKPDLLLYDYFSLEGNFAGKITGIPYWSSVPALMGPFNYQNYLKIKLNLPINIAAINKLRRKFPKILNGKKIEMISDGLHLPGQKNLLWSYPALTPANFMVNRQPAEYVFVGHLNKLVTNRIKPQVKKRPLVYFSFGTVVMDNLWNQQTEIRDRLKVFIGKLAELSKGKEFDVLFVNRGKPILNTYPSNWQVVNYADQIAALTRASVFITHAGGNSFHESVLQKVPMIAVPFFGDQPLVASQIEKLGLGKNLGSGSDIDTKKSKNFLNESLAEKIYSTLINMFDNLDRYKNKFDQLSLKAEDISVLLKGQSSI